MVVTKLFPFTDISWQWSKWMRQESSILQSCSTLSRAIILVQMEPPHLPAQATGMTTDLSGCCYCIRYTMACPVFCSYFDGDVPEEDKPDTFEEEEDDINLNQKKPSLKLGQ